MDDSGTKNSSGVEFDCNCDQYNILSLQSVAYYESVFTKEKVYLKTGLGGSLVSENHCYMPRLAPDSGSLAGLVRIWARQLPQNSAEAACFLEAVCSFICS